MWTSQDRKGRILEFSRVGAPHDSQPNSADFGAWRVNQGVLAGVSAWEKGKSGPHWHLSSNTGLCQAEILSSQSAYRHSA